MTRIVIGLFFAAILAAGVAGCNFRIYHKSLAACQKVCSLSCRETIDDDFYCPPRLDHSSQDTLEKCGSECACGAPPPSTEAGDSKAENAYAVCLTDCYQCRKRSVSDW